MKFLLKFQWPVSISIVQDNHKTSKSAGELKQARLVIKPPCKICGKQVPLGRKILCSEKCRIIYDQTRDHHEKETMQRKPKCDLCDTRAMYLTPPRCKKCYMREYWKRRKMMIEKAPECELAKPLCIVCNRRSIIYRKRKECKQCYQNQWLKEKSRIVKTLNNFNKQLPEDAQEFPPPPIPEVDKPYLKKIFNS